MTTSAGGRGKDIAHFVNAGSAADDPPGSPQGAVRKYVAGVGAVSELKSLAAAD